MRSLAIIKAATGAKGVFRFRHRSSYMRSVTNPGTEQRKLAAIMFTARGGGSDASGAQRNARLN